PLQITQVHSRSAHTAKAKAVDTEQQLMRILADMLMQCTIGYFRLDYCMQGLMLYGNAY
ncbi:MAG: hypothetical protein GX939_05545, partial [Clostridiaceae bacterium]|nr:hypothetical protein [Clostridiaceae bacterium]